MFDLHLFQVRISCWTRAPHALIECLLRFSLRKLSQKAGLQSEDFQDSELIPIIVAFRNSNFGKIYLWTADLDNVRTGNILQRTVLAQQVGNRGWRGWTGRISPGGRFIQWRPPGWVCGIYIGSVGEQELDASLISSIHFAHQPRDAR